MKHCSAAMSTRRQATYFGSNPRSENVFEEQHGLNTLNFGQFIEQRLIRRVKTLDPQKYVWTFLLCNVITVSTIDGSSGFKIVVEVSNSILERNGDMKGSASRLWNRNDFRVVEEQRMTCTTLRKTNMLEVAQAQGCVKKRMRNGRAFKILVDAALSGWLHEFLETTNRADLNRQCHIHLIRSQTIKLGI